MVEEMFMRQLQLGDVFILSGRPFRLERIGLMECFVSKADNAIPTVPAGTRTKCLFPTESRQRLPDFVPSFVIRSRPRRVRRFNQRLPAASSTRTRGEQQGDCRLDFRALG